MTPISLKVDPRDQPELELMIRGWNAEELLRRRKEREANPAVRQNENLTGFAPLGFDLPEARAMMDQLQGYRRLLLDRRHILDNADLQIRKLSESTGFWPDQEKRHQSSSQSSTRRVGVNLTKEWPYMKLRNYSLEDIPNSTGRRPNYGYFTPSELAEESDRLIHLERLARHHNRTPSAPHFSPSVEQDSKELEPLGWKSHLVSAMLSHRWALFRLLEERNHHLDRISPYKREVLELAISRRVKAIVDLSYI